MLAEVEKATNWVDMVRTIDKERKSLPWDPTTTQPVERVSLYHRKRQEREFDPVVMKFRDPERENHIQELKQTQLLERAQTVQSSRKKVFNILSHEGPPRRIESLPQLRTNDPSAKRPYHILSNLPKPAQSDAPTLYNADFHIHHLHAQSQERIRTSTGHGREFNIISNDYFVNPQEKKREEYNRMKTHVLDKYWATHDFDMIKGQYYSDEKERTFHEQNRILQEVQGRSLERTLPPCIEYSDGHSYNILNHDVYDETRLKATMTMADRSLNRMKKREVEQVQKAIGETRGEIAERRRMARIGYQKYETELSKGFNFITNEKSPDRPQAIPPRPSTMWARISIDNNDSQNAAAGVSRGEALGIAEGSNGFSNNNNHSNDAVGSSNKPLTTASGHRIRNLSGVGEPYVTARASGREPLSTMAHSSSSNAVGMNNRVNSRGDRVPALDIAKADFGQPVSYIEPMHKVPSGAAIPIVRTGGLSSHRI